MESHATIVWTAQPMTDSVPESVFAVEVEKLQLQFERIGVDAAKEIHRLAYTTPQHAAIQLMIVRTNFITIEAQNALLKLFEEPPLTTRFLLLVPSTLQVLPTLLSRVQQETATTSDTHDIPSAVYLEFKAAPLAERLKMIEVELKKKDSSWLYDFQQSYVTWLRAGQVVNPALQLVAERLNTRGASNKMLLELLALELPNN